MWSALILGVTVTAAAFDSACVPKYAEGRYLINISVDANTTRPLVVDVPSSKSRGKSIGLSDGGMIGFHGWHSNPWYYDKLANATNMTRHYGMVLALPFGTAPLETYYCCPESVTLEECTSGNYLADSLNRSCGWNAGPNSSYPSGYINVMDDLAYLKSIARFLVDELCVDERKIFAMGLSAGGSMAARAACEAADVLAGVATMSGGLGLDECKPAKPIVYIQFCGTIDGSCNETTTDIFRLWSQLDECKEVQTRDTYQSATTRCRVATDCAAASFAEQCLIIDLGDDIPGHDRSAPIIPNTTLILQSASNVDSVKYAFDRFSAIFPSPDWSSWPENF